MLDTLLEHALKEWAVIREAPVAFLVCVALVGVLIFFGVEWFHGERVATQGERIRLLTERLDEARLSVKTVTEAATTPVLVNLTPLFAAFERVAGEETSLALLLYVKEFQLPANQTVATNVYDRVILTAEQKDHWRGTLKALDGECEKNGLVATRAAIQEAINRFDAEINRVTAYWAYHSVSLALKAEIGRSAALSRLHPEIKP